MTDTAELIARLRAAMGLMAIEDGRQAKLHDLLETIREQIRLEVAPEHRPVALFTNIQNAVYAMRGRTPLLDDAAIAETLREAADALSSLVRERDAYQIALNKIDAIRNSIIGFQSVGWSEHIYPLVAALGDAGFPGAGYEASRKNVSTLLEQIKAAEARATAAEADAARMREALMLPDASRRLLFISDTLSSKGYFNRSDICVAFGVSVPQASADISRWLRGNPGVAEYDKSAKRYTRASLSNTGRQG